MLRRESEKGTEPTRARPQLRLVVDNAAAGGAAMSEVTPIHADVKVSKRSTRRKNAVDGLMLRVSGEHEGFSTIDVLNGLHGVRETLDRMAQDLHLDQRHELSTAANVLSAILRDRLVA
jgi:hypothetical protein